MNLFTLWGTVVKTPLLRNSDPSKPPRVEFFVSTPSRIPYRPMKFFCTGIGKHGEDAAALHVGDNVLVAGKLEPNFLEDGKLTGLSILINGLENFGG